ncbi:MAG: fluoride efflux transporter CrcB [Helicobacteraceae bacterium]|nr:fluoride efflux transporter CrcB [Helicobacteraceae bacterium]
MSWQTLLAIGSGGFIGAVSRAYLNGYFTTKFPHDLPFGTVGVNVLGSFLMGILFAYFMYTTIFSTTIKSFLSTGLLGALTTYSTFAIESFVLLHNGHVVLALSNILLNTFGSIISAGIGFYSASTYLK